MTLAKFSRDCIPAGPGKIDVRDDNVRPEKATHLQCLVSSQNRLNLVTLVPQNYSQCRCGVPLVIRNKNTKRMTLGNAIAGRHDPKRRFEGHEALLSTLENYVADTKVYAYWRRVPDCRAMCVRMVQPTTPEGRFELHSRSLCRQRHPVVYFRSRMIDRLLERHGLALVFANVMFEQVGLPIPAVPTLVVAGALAAEGRISALAVLAVAFVACMIGDGLWFFIGRYYGRRALRFLCGVSLSPDSCVRQTQTQFDRWGGVTLVVGKFIPGLSTVAPPLAGAMRYSWTRFALLNALGVAIWAGLAIGAGMLFRTQVSALLVWVEDLGQLAVGLLVAILSVYVALKWWERQRLYKTLRVARITVDELRQLMGGTTKPVIVDLRAAIPGENRRSIPGAVVMNLAEVREGRVRLPLDNDVVFFCDCPNEESAASAAKALMDLGYTRVRPLLGGLDAWIRAGHEVEETVQ